MISTGVICREFIGRSVEFEFLLERASRARDGHGTNLLVTGNAGIGKTRLLAEFSDALKRIGIASATASCREFGDSPYAPLIEIAETLGAHSAANALVEVASDAGVGSGRERIRRYANFAAALAQCAASGVVVAVVEDIHWADFATLELYRYLTSALKEHAFVLIATQRNDEALGEGDPAAARLRNAIEREAAATVALNALPPAEIRMLLTVVLREDGRRVPKVLLEEIADLSDGRPFHAEELLRGMLDRTREATETTINVVPPSLRATVHDRLASLTERERTVLAYAAVIGRRFSAHFLARLAQETLADVLVTLRRSRNLQLIIEDHDGEHFLFRHALTREVVYEEILFAEARSLHAQIAAELSREATPDRVAIAYHAWRSGDRALSVRNNELAGDAAAVIFAHTDAIRHFDRAHQSAIDPPERARLAEKTASALYAIGDLVEAAAWYAHAVTDARRAGDSGHANRVALESARCLFEGGRHDEGIAMAEAVTIDLANVDSALRFQADTMTAGLLTARNKPALALAHLEDAGRLQSTPDPRWAARYLSIKADTLRQLRRYAESHETFGEAVQIAQTIGDRELTTRVLNNWALLHIDRGDLLGAHVRYTDGLAAAHELQSNRLLAWVGQNLAYVTLLIGKLDEARAHYLEAAAIDNEVVVARLWGQAVAYRIATLTGDAALLARAQIDAALAEATSMENTPLITFISGAIVARRILLREHIMPLARDAWRAGAGTTACAYWLLDAIARDGGPLVSEAREALAAMAADDQAGANGAHLLLFDARVLLRNREREAAEKLAREARRVFSQLGWALEAAYAAEVAGDVKSAVEAFRTMGATAEVTRLTTTDRNAPRKRGETTLTKREREIATLIAAAKTNRQIAETLVISERTVETHVASIYQKLGVSSRRELGQLLGS